MSDAILCASDLSVLDLLFEPLQGEKNSTEVVQPTKDEVDAKYDEEENSNVILKSKNLELEGVELTEAGKLDEALEKFDAAIAVSSQRPSPYNNRAQLYRFLDKDECKISITIFYVENDINLYFSVALVDLTKSIALSNNTHPITKCRALCQRGIIKRKLGDIEGARDDFNEGAQLGSQYARQQLVVLNPYARLCNQMVTKLLTDMQ